MNDLEKKKKEHQKMNESSSDCVVFRPNCAVRAVTNSFSQQLLEETTTYNKLTYRIEI